MVTAYQVYLERKELPGIRATLMLHKRNNTLFFLLPKDVLKNCILSRIVPFHTKQINPCISAQLALMQRLITGIPTPAPSLSIAELPNEEASKIQESLALFNGQNVEQHQEQLVRTTRALMGLSSIEAHSAINT